ncbi:MAG: beta-ketoacyl-[acyl-carrier-protein] synthase family protein [Pontiellaceae bacterium]|nr:beta-ketoacyl-[acyl-carrier-protein] synthase family protein [Pontiellaceae bacterium]MBN2785465.1 beta-ketoacyl-[acyl-carrier-protein] synthase family protein [Pontiellaceae bacterium]
MIGRNRVVITGIGVLAANGIGKEAFWQSLLNGESGIGPITRCNTDNLSSQIAGEVGDFDVNDYTPYKIKAKRLSRNTQLAVAAAWQSINDASLNLNKITQNAPLSLVLGISMSGFDFIESEIRRIVAKGNQYMLPTVIGCIHIASASTVAELMGIPCTINVLSNSCVGGVDAIAKAYNDIRTGKTDVALAGGSDAPIETSLVSGFCAARMLCTDNDSPGTASKPFDLNRSQGVLAEGSCVVVLENLETALSRGAQPYAEIIGFGSASDPSPIAGSGLGISMQQALSNSCQAPSGIDFISAHAPSDQEIDLTETNMIKEVFGNRAYHIPISSIKGSTGNPLAAGGAMQVGSTAIILKEQTIPPTANYKRADPQCDLDYVAAQPRHQSITSALVNSHGIGRVNSSLVMKQILPL